VGTQSVYKATILSSSHYVLVMPDNERVDALDPTLTYHRLQYPSLSTTSESRSSRLTWAVNIRTATFDERCAHPLWVVATDQRTGGAGFKPNKHVIPCAVPRTEMSPLYIQLISHLASGSVLTHGKTCVSVSPKSFLISPGPWLGFAYDWESWVSFRWDLRQVVTTHQRTAAV